MAPHALTAGKGRATLSSKACYRDHGVVGDADNEVADHQTPRWLRHGGSCAQRLLGIRWTTRRQKQSRYHQQIRQSRTVTQLSPHHAQPLPHPGASPGSSFPSRKSRLPVAFPPQLCLHCCRSRHGEEAQHWTTREGLHWALGRPHCLRFCPVCSWLSQIRGLTSTPRHAKPGRSSFPPGPHSRKHIPKAAEEASSVFSLLGAVPLCSVLSSLLKFS